MSIVNSIETVRDWLTAEVCPLVTVSYTHLTLPTIRLV